MYSYFKAEISAIINPESPCYTACKSCQRKVFVEDSIANCNNCNTEDAEWEIKYLMRLEVKDHIDKAYVTLFDEARFLTGCSAEEYVDSFDEEGKEHLSPMYQKMMSCCDKEYLFLVKMNRKDEEKRIEGRITAQEICSPNNFEPIKCDEDEDSKDISLKRKSMTSLKKDMNKRKFMNNKNIKIESEK
ncbi:replication protein A 70 kDa DNA-binding subunit B-like [Asparagus officinalis]|uniref:replication protein A 70 kDa DNA-binding subunit B-like n=1 Tax=Asparagus officinalis TaxID=4686 RepID=UPI00098E722F|nr:replication protein A 70 kDa DNA-binding subunit B-like [Asparagus officinalis]